MESSKVICVKRILTVVLSFVLLITLNSVVYGQWTSISPAAVNSDGGLYNFHLLSSAEERAVGEDDGNLTDVLAQGISTVSPNEGTIGTQFTISGSGFGSIEGKVLVGKAAPKILQWTDSSIECQLLKALAPGIYDITVQPKGASVIVSPGSFSVMSPDIGYVRPPGGSANDQITIYGLFFGTPKGKVTLGGKSCKVLSWTMDPTTGESQIEFVVPKGLTTGGTELKVTNEVGSETTNFNVGIPTPSGIYVVNETSNEQSTATAYASGLTSSPAYQNDVTGHAIFVPIAQVLPNITTWGQFNWDWTYLDTLVQIAVSNGKKFSVELETGFQSSSTYLHSLPSGFAATCGADCAPLFDVWATGGSGGRCISAYVLLPWVPNVQQFWSAAAAALADHLKQTGVYGSLTLVHVPGLSVYDEEIRLPTGFPSPSPTDTGACPDGRPAYPTVINDADISRWQSLGYSDAAVINGFKVIAMAFAQAFPDRFLGLSLFNPGPNGIDFPNLTNDPPGYVASQIVQEVTAIAPGRVQLQSDNLDSNFAQSEVLSLAAQYGDLIAWQTNKHAETGAGCDGGGPGSCNPDGPNSPYFELLKNGWDNGGAYLEVWSTDVVSYPQSFAGAIAAGYYVENTFPPPVVGLGLGGP